MTVKFIIDRTEDEHRYQQALSVTTPDRDDEIKLVLGCEGTYLDVREADELLNALHQATGRGELP